MDLGSLVFDWIVISRTSGWSSRAVNGHGKEYWCQYVRSRRLDDERRILCGLNNRLWSRYWAMGWLLSVWASCDWALVGGLPDVYSSSNKEERTGLLLVLAWELLCVFPEITSTRKGETRGDSEAQLENSKRTINRCMEVRWSYMKTEDWGAQSVLAETRYWKEVYEAPILSKFGSNLVIPFL